MEGQLAALYRSCGGDMMFQPIRPNLLKQGVDESTHAARVAGGGAAAGARSETDLGAFPVIGDGSGCAPVTPAVAPTTSLCFGQRRAEGGCEVASICDSSWNAWWKGTLISQRTLLLLVSFAWFLILGAVLVVAVAASVFTFHKYTYWNLCLTVLGLGWMFLGVLVEGGLLKCALIYAYPVVSCSNFLVTVIINVILASNGFLLVEGTEFGFGRVSMGAVHLGDTMVHPAPLFALLFCLASGLLGYGRAIVSDYFYTELTGAGKLKFVAYWYVAPLLLLALYGSIFDPLAEYPTSLGVWSWGALIVCVAFVFQTLNLLWLLCPSGNRVFVPVYVDHIAAAASWRSPQGPDINVAAMTRGFDKGVYIAGNIDGSAVHKTGATKEVGVVTGGAGAHHHSVSNRTGGVGGSGVMQLGPASSARKLE